MKCWNRKSCLKDTLLTSPRHQTTKMQGPGGLMLHNEQHTDKKNILKFSNRMLNWEKQRESSPHTIYGACRLQGFHFIWNCFEDTPLDWCVRSVQRRKRKMGSGDLQALLSLTPSIQNSRCRDSRWGCPTWTNTKCQVIPQVHARTHTPAMQKTCRVGWSGWGVAGNRNKNMHACGTHEQNRSSLHIHWENCPSLSLIPSVCLRQLVITKATHCCGGKPWGRTHREDGEACRGGAHKEKKAINEGERPHQLDQLQSAFTRRRRRARSVSAW